MKKLLKKGFITAIAYVLILTSCSKDDGPTPTLTPEPEVVLSSAKQLTSFVFFAVDNASLSQDVTAILDESTKTITISLTSIIEITALTPTLIVSDKASVNPSGAQDFTNPVAYTVTAEDGSEVIYNATLTKPLSQKEILQTIIDVNPNNTLNWDLTNTADLDLGSLNGVTTNVEGVIITLDLESVDLVEIPVEIENLEALTVLRLVGNEIDELPSEIGSLINLIELNLENNNLTALPTEIEKLTKLTKLHLTFNSLTSIPLELSNLIALEELYLSFNQLNTLPVEIGNLDNLRDLQLGDNQLQNIPAEIGRLVNVFRIILRNNQLIAVPEELGLLDNLTSLILTGNSFSIIPSAVCNLSEFGILTLQKDANVTCETVSPKDALISIYSANPNNTLGWGVNTYPGVTFNGQQSIIELDLREKGISRIESGVATLESLELLDVRDNPLASIHNDVCVLTFTSNLTILADIGEGCN